MSQIQIFNRTFLRGLETTRDESGAPDWSGFRRFLNTRVGKDEAERRGGMSVIATMTDVSSAASFNGTAAVGASGADVWALDRPSWALDFLLTCRAQLTTEDFFVAGSIHIHKASGNLIFDIGTASISVAIPDTLPHHYAMVREAQEYVLLLDAEEITRVPWVAPSVVGPTILLGNGLYDLDFFRLRAPAPAKWSSPDLRLLNPRARGVLACYRDAQDDNDILWDHSIYERHLKCDGMNSPMARLSDVRHVPVQGMQTYVDENDRRRLFIVAGGEEYDAPYE